MTRIEEFLRQGIQGRVFPGAAFALGDSSHSWVGTVGNLTYAPECQPVLESTLYDLASLTKVIATTTSAMCLHQDGVLELDAYVHDILPEFRGEGKGRVTIRHLLTHHSGLPGVREYWRFEGTVQDRIHAVLAEPLIHAPGQTAEYSCVGFLVLHQVLQALTGERYDEAWTWPFFRIAAQSGWRFCFNPAEGVRADCAPTEIDSASGLALRGQVHDENARSLGGIAGNAGLFGTIHDVAGFAQMILQGGSGFLDPEIVTTWTRRQSGGDPSSTRALGWDTRASEESSAGTKMGPRAFGHLGFTGTSLWIDPDAGIFVALLTNRVHPTREGPMMLPWRARIADLAFEALHK